ncbi:aminotransferase class IV [Nocardia jejuensis]|uniref:aminotransferase class IV n=1 Tax=Nocardia jejuensis TaxID=328049 RepID=UPI00083510F0|nr:aminotransferase class IV [Nocardia jejuensis]
MELNGVPVTTAEIAPLGLVGYGHFTSMRVIDGAVRGLTLHLDRLRRDCREVFATDLDTDLVRDLVRHALPATAGPLVARVTVFDPGLELAHPGAPADPKILITTRAAPQLPPTPLTLQSVVFRRDMSRVKHTGLFGPMYLRASAQRAGFDDVLFTEPDGTISEIATSNIGFITGEGQLIWPDAEVLPGTTMRLISQARDEEVLTEKVTLAHLGTVAAVVATNAAVGVRAVAAIDDTRFPVEHDLIDTLRREYDSIPPQRI